MGAESQPAFSAYDRLKFLAVTPVANRGEIVELLKNGFNEKDLASLSRSRPAEFGEIKTLARKFEVDLSDKLPRTRKQPKQ